jgi:hypothetical protein
MALLKQVLVIIRGPRLLGHDPRQKRSPNARSNDVRVRQHHIGHSFKNRTGDRTGETIGSGFYRSDHWFTGSQSGFISYKLIYFTYKYCDK